MRTSLALLLVPLALGLAYADSEAPTPGGLAPPVRLAVDGEPIDVQTGRAAPWVCDWDGDGRNDLLVGQFGGGKLRIFPNVATAGEPSLGTPIAFLAGGAEGTIPSG
jgi:hypothetical protein